MSQNDGPKRDPEIQNRYETETISASGLSEFAKSPRAYRAYKDKEQESCESYFELGKAIHCKILEPEKFDDQYYLMDVEAPGGFMGTLIDKYFWYLSNEFADEMARDLAYKDSGYKTKAETVWKNFEEKEECIAYWNALNESKGKVILTPKDEFVIENCVDSVLNHKTANSLLDVDPTSDYTYLTEYDMRWSLSGFDFTMRSILDRAIIDKENKVVNIIDLKTTSKNVHKFSYSYENFSYYRQMAFYGHAMMWYIENVLKEDRKDWHLTTTIIAVQTSGFYETVVYAPAPADMQIGHYEIFNLLTKLNWHFENDLWDYPLDYYTSGGIMPLALDPTKYGINGETGQDKSSND
jgi:hypothetical protein